MGLPRDVRPAAHLPRPPPHRHPARDDRPLGPALGERHGRLSAHRRPAKRPSTPTPKSTPATARP
nr:MAG TPA: hypothetical protein [Caudoviricetes sp.]